MLQLHLNKLKKEIKMGFKKTNIETKINIRLFMNLLLAFFIFIIFIIQISYFSAQDEGPSGWWEENPNGKKIFLASGSLDVPLGFNSLEEWEEYRRIVSARINALGNQDPRFRDIDIRLFGSASTGVSSKTGERILKPNDFDFMLVREDLFNDVIERARALAREGKLFPSYSIDEQLAMVARSESQGIIHIVDSRLLPEVPRESLATRNMQQGIKISTSVAKPDSSATKPAHHSLTPNTPPRRSTLAPPATPVTPPTISPLKCDGNLGNTAARNLLESIEEYEKYRKDFFKRMKNLEERAISRISSPTLDDIRQSIERHNAFSHPFQLGERVSISDIMNREVNELERMAEDLRRLGDNSLADKLDKGAGKIRENIRLLREKRLCNLAKEGKALKGSLTITRSIESGEVPVKYKPLTGEELKQFLREARITCGLNPPEKLSIWKRFLGTSARASRAIGRGIRAVTGTIPGVGAGIVIGGGIFAGEINAQTIGEAIRSEIPIVGEVEAAHSVGTLIAESHEEAVRRERLREEAMSELNPEEKSLIESIFNKEDLDALMANVENFGGILVSDQSIKENFKDLVIKAARSKRGFPLQIIDDDFRNKFLCEIPQPFAFKGRLITEPDENFPNPPTWKQTIYVLSTELAYTPAILRWDATNVPRRMLEDSPGLALRSGVETCRATSSPSVSQWDGEKQISGTFDVPQLEMTSYTFYLECLNAAGGTNRAEVTVIFSDGGPVCSPDGISVRRNQPTRFRAEVLGGNCRGCTWRAIAGTPEFGSGTSFTTKFSVRGNYQVEVTDSNGRSDVCEVRVETTECSDLEDNDGDGTIDYSTSGSVTISGLGTISSDRDCMNAEDNDESRDDESSTTTTGAPIMGTCDDGIDNDGDLRLDSADCDCVSSRAIGLEVYQRSNLERIYNPSCVTHTSASGEGPAGGGGGSGGGSGTGTCPVGQTLVNGVCTSGVSPTETSPS